MKKIISVLLCVFLLTSCFIFGVGAEDDALRFGEDGKFTVLQITDPQDDAYPAHGLKEFIEKAKTVTKDTDWLGFKDVFGKSGGLNCDRGYDYSYIHNGEYVLIVEEGYQAHLRKISDTDFWQKID